MQWWPWGLVFVFSMMMVLSKPGYICECGWHVSGYMICLQPQPVMQPYLTQHGQPQLVNFFWLLLQLSITLHYLASSACKSCHSFFLFPPHSHVTVSTLSVFFIQPDSDVKVTHISCPWLDHDYRPTRHIVFLWACSVSFISHLVIFLATQVVMTDA